MTQKLKTQILSKFFENGIQLSSAALEKIIANQNPAHFSDHLIENAKTENKVFITPDMFKEVPQNCSAAVSILVNYDEKYSFSGISDMSAYFTARFSYFKKQLQPRLSNVISINNAKKMVREKVSIIAIVSDKKKTKNNNILFSLEDPTGQLKVIATKPELIAEAEAIVYDDVLGFSGSMGEGIMFLDEFLWPDIPVHKESKSVDNSIAAFISDTHIGSNEFLESKFQHFIDWLNGKHDTTTDLYPHLSENLKYIFIAGDLVDGVGIYPRQNKDLKIQDIFDQHKKATELLSQIPEHISIIISPGNHDYVRMAQPQPPIPREVAAELYELPNVKMVSNPALIEIGKKPHSTKVLMYHGTSIDGIGTSARSTGQTLCLSQTTATR